MNSVVLGWPLVFAVVLLAVLATLVTGLAGLGRWSQAGTATVRAVAQLAVVSVLIGAVIKSLPLTAAFLLAMITVAAGTSAHRITGHLRWRAWWAGVAIAAGAIPPLAVLILTGTLPASPAALLPTGGILIGGAMTATSLAGRRVTEELTHHRGSYEAALSLGMTRRQSVDLVARPAAGLALVPGLDQTRTVGLVTLPGAFIGMLLAGASPAQAGAVQLIVLVALLLTQSLAAACTLELIAAGLIPVGVTPLPA